MESRIRARYTEAVLNVARDRYGIRPGEIRALDAFESFIFEFEDRASRHLILRLSHSLRRSESLIRAELDWINYLSAGGASVARAVPSPGGNLVETIDDGVGGQFYATAFTKAEGVPPRDAGWTPSLYESYGRLIGRMHALTRSYRPRAEWRRPDWDDEIFEFVDHFLPDGETVARTKYAEVCEHLRTLPRNRTSYGLVHQDAHGGNLHVDKSGRLTLFDFDDCGYNWFANDIAIVLFYMAMGDRHTSEFATLFMDHFLRGYRQENALGDWWLGEIPWFLKLREIELYAVIHRDFDIPDGDVSAIEDEWCAAYMRGRKARIEGDTPYLDMDFERLAS